MLLHHSTKSIKEKDINHQWHLIDMKNIPLGRGATQIAGFLIGKHKKQYVSYLDCGDFVVVINSTKSILTGSKAQKKVFSRYSGYPGGLTQVPYAKMMKTNPNEVVRHAVSGMLPKNKLRDKRLARLHIYKDDQHPYGIKFEKKVKSE